MTGTKKQGWSWAGSAERNLSDWRTMNNLVEEMGVRTLSRACARDLTRQAHRFQAALALLIGRPPISEIALRILVVARLYGKTFLESVSMSCLTGC